MLQTELVTGRHLASRWVLFQDNYLALALDIQGSHVLLITLGSLSVALCSFMHFCSFYVDRNQELSEDMLPLLMSLGRKGSSTTLYSFPSVADGTASWKVTFAHDFTTLFSSFLYYLLHHRHHFYSVSSIPNIVFFIVLTLFSNILSYIL